MLKSWEELKRHSQRWRNVDYPFTGRGRFRRPLVATPTTISLALSLTVFPDSRLTSPALSLDSVTALPWNLRQVASRERLPPSFIEI